jgi:hypothetical protein
VVVFRPLLLALRDGLETQFWLLSEAQEQAVQVEQLEGRRRSKSSQSEQKRDFRDRRAENRGARPGQRVRQSSSTR